MKRLMMVALVALLAGCKMNVTPEVYGLGLAGRGGRWGYGAHHSG